MGMHGHGVRMGRGVISPSAPLKVFRDRGKRDYRKPKSKLLPRLHCHTIFMILSNNPDRQAGKIKASEVGGEAEEWLSLPENT